ncbi:hypothetical protein AVEN_21798-1 [Araneus ventricosus]|uniref:Uncharacterized protein n=1 Tax=Araneus ventricosus TaxID=182803 RepID=A0A4Y2IT28_ARAVE|nr:hypothetical protein AVEN_21798-1 [Araneus ventricosus]
MTGRTSVKEEVVACVVRNGSYNARDTVPAFCRGGQSFNFNPDAEAGRGCFFAIAQRVQSLSQIGGKLHVLRNSSTSISIPSIWLLRLLHVPKHDKVAGWRELFIYQLIAEISDICEGIDKLCYIDKIRGGGDSSIVELSV